MKQTSEFSDVTLVHEDYQYLQAHRVLLIAKQYNSEYCGKYLSCKKKNTKKNIKPKLPKKKNIKHKTQKKHKT